MKMRPLSEQELDLIKFLLSKSVQGRLLIPSLGQKLVRPMDDGGMGSLAFYNNDDSNVRFGKTLITVEFVDSDAIPVSAALTLNSDNNLYELDIWKVDFSRLKTWPEISQIRLVGPTFR